MLVAYLFVFNLRLKSAISEGNAQMICQSIVLILVHTSLMVEDSVLFIFFYRFDETLIMAFVCNMRALVQGNTCVSHIQMLISYVLFCLWIKIKQNIH